MIKPHITVFADASVAPKEKAAGYGVWMKGDARPSRTFSGPLPWHPSTILGELRALEAALTCAELDRYFLASDSVIMLQSDNATALSSILGFVPGATLSEHKDSAAVGRRRKRMDAETAAAVANIRAVLERNGFTSVQLRHVRGHKAGGGRNWVNRTCDRLAKKGRQMHPDAPGPVEAIQ